MEQRDKDRLFGLIRSAVTDQEPDSALFAGMKPADWDGLFRLCASQGVVALVCPVALPLVAGRERTLAIRWALSAESIEQRFEAQRAVARRLSELYAAAGVRMLIMKGLGLARYYPHPQARECGDVDIWLFGNYEKGNSVALEAGALSDHITSKHASFLLDGVLVENHLTFLNVSGSRADRALEKALEERARRPVSWEGLLLPSPAFHALFLVRHAAGHLIRGLTLRNLLDWGLFLRADGDRADWPAAASLLARYGYGRAADVFTGVASRLCGADLSRFLIGERDRPLEDRVIDRLTAPSGRVPSGTVGSLAFKARRALASRWIFDLLLPGSFASYAARSAVVSLKLSLTRKIN